MDTIEILLEFFGGLVLLIVFGCLIGYFIKSDKFFDDGQPNKDIHLRRMDVKKNESGNQV
jgi:hypothetical protein